MVSLHCTLLTAMSAQPTVKKSDIILLYETSLSNGLLANEPISNTAGYEEVYIFCQFPLPTTEAAWLPPQLLERQYRH